ncbi:MAG: hypothetical protein ACJAT1_001157, partial [Marivirga sp.]
FIVPSLEEYTVPVVSIKLEILCGLMLMTETGILISVSIDDFSLLHPVITVISKRVIDRSRLPCLLKFGVRVDDLVSALPRRDSRFMIAVFRCMVYVFRG